jgi:thymidylate synthase
MKAQILRKPFDFPKVEIKQLRENINDYQIGDFDIFGYNSHEQIKINMRK